MWMEARHGASHAHLERTDCAGGRREETVKVSVPYGLLDPDAHERTGHDSRAFQRDEVT